MKYRGNAELKVGWEISIDLVNDMQNIAYQLLQRSGYKDVDAKRALYQYYNLERRIVSNHKRVIHKSRQFTCPEGYEEALSMLEQKVREGESLLPYMSEKWKMASYNDDLLNDWNLYHFHLTKRFREDGTAKRSDYEIIAYVTETDMYFLQVYRHMMAYHKYELIEIMKDNWPDIIEQYRLKDVIELVNRPTEEEYRQLRKAHVSCFVQLEDKSVYGLIGGGYMSDGSSGAALRESDYWLNLVRKVQDVIVANANVFSDAIGRFCKKTLAKYEIRLLWFESKDKVTLAETNNHVIIQIDYQKGYLRICNPWEVFEIEELRGLIPIYRRQW